MKTINFLLLFFVCVSSYAQYLGPQLSLSKQYFEKTRGSTKNYSTGFLPFSENGALRGAYNGNYENKDVFQELQSTGLALPTDSLVATSLFVELISYVPNSSIGRFSFGTQLNHADLKSDSTKSRTDIALQKLMNGGGNFIIQFNRPILYVPFSSNGTGHFLINVGASAFFDIRKLNQDFYNPGWGINPNIDFDLRFWSNASNFSGDEARMIGNLFKFGLRGRVLGNFFNKKYIQAYEVDLRLNNAIIFSTGAYLSLGPILFETGFNIDNKQLFDSKKYYFRLGFQPVKW